MGCVCLCASPTKEDLLTALLLAGRDGVPVDIVTTTHGANALDALLEFGAVCESAAGRLHLTSSGLVHCTLLQAVGEPCHALTAREGVSLDELSTYELLQKLFAAGWELVQVERSSPKLCPPFRLGGTFRFFMKASRDKLSHPYLRALLTAASRPASTVVPHFKSDYWYVSLIAGVPFKPKQRLPIAYATHRSYPEELWPDDEDRPPPCRRARRARELRPLMDVPSRAVCERRESDEEEDRWWCWWWCWSRCWWWCWWCWWWWWWWCWSWLVR